MENIKPRKNIRCFNQNNQLNQRSDEFSRKTQHQRKALQWRWFRENIQPARRFEINKMVEKSSEDELEGKEQWSELIEFLEKEARVH